MNRAFCVLILGVCLVSLALVQLWARSGDQEYLGIPDTGEAATVTPPTIEQAGLEERLLPSAPVESMAGYEVHSGDLDGSRNDAVQGRRSGQAVSLFAREQYSLREAISVAMSCIADILDADGEAITLEPGSEWSMREFMSENEQPIFRSGDKGPRLYLASRHRFPGFFVLIDRSRTTNPGIVADSKDPLATPAKAWLLGLASRADFETSD